MIGRVLRRALLVATFIALPALGHAQEAVLTGTVTDSTGGVLPGVTIIALHEVTGNRFEAITDATGNYRLPVRVGALTVTAELQGFTTVTRPGIHAERSTGEHSAAAERIAPPRSVSTMCEIRGRAVRC